MSWWADASPWRSGDWTLQRRDDELADIAFAGEIVLRSVRAVVRDHDWDTVPLVIEQVEEGAGVLTLFVHSDRLGSSFRGIVEVNAAGDQLHIRTELQSVEEFSTNRTGLVVLHPAGLAGTALEVTHPDGSIETSRFPAAISPHQPVVDIAALGWHTDGVAVEVRFDGDVFEMEDQRNWTDASYKTYSRPLALPFPYVVPAGGLVRQTVTVRAARRVAAPRTHTGGGDDPVRLVLEPAGPFPAIGLGAATAPDPAPRDAAPFSPDFLLVELDLSTPNWPAALARAASAAVPLDVRVILERERGRGDALDDAAVALRSLDVIRVAAFQSAGGSAHVSDLEAVEYVRAALDRAGVEVDVIGGSRSHFTELNREGHRIPRDVTGLATTVTPLFHDLGTAQLVESLAIQRLVAESAVARAHGMPVHIGPVSLRPRFNNVATAAQPSTAAVDLTDGYGAEVTGAVDSRQRAPELAAWTIASAAALAVEGVASLSWFEEWGPRGIRSADGTPYPVADALAALAGLNGGELLSGASPDGLIWALGSRHRAEIRVLVANVGREERSVEVNVGGTHLRAVVAAGGFFSVPAAGHGSI